MLTSIQNAKFIIVDDDGNVRIDFGDKSEKQQKKILDKDKGLRLVKDLVDDLKNKYGYSTLGPDDMDYDNGDKTGKGWPEHQSGENAYNKNQVPGGGVVIKQAKAYSYNASKTKYGTDGSGNPQPTLLPKAGFDAQVGIAPGEPGIYVIQHTLVSDEKYDPVLNKVTPAQYKDEMTIKNVRPQMIRHELQESYNRTHDGMDYNAAHDKAIQQQGAEGSKIGSFIFK